MCVIPRGAPLILILCHFHMLQVICTGGTASRIRDLMLYIREKLTLPNKGEPVDLSAGGHRYALYKEGPVMCVSHGVGSSTFSVVLHELLKLVKYAKCHEPVFLRIGTCGGVGIPPGTVVVTKDAFNGYLRNEHEIVSKYVCVYIYINMFYQPILGKRVIRPASFPTEIIQSILSWGTLAGDRFETISANTMATDCFYEGKWFYHNLISI